AAAGGLHRVASLLECGGKKGQELRVVVDDQNPRRSHGKTNVPCGTRLASTVDRSASRVLSRAAFTNRSWRIRHAQASFEPPRPFGARRLQETGPGQRACGQC